MFQIPQTLMSVIPIMEDVNRPATIPLVALCVTAFLDTSWMEMASTATVSALGELLFI